MSTEQLLILVVPIVLMQATQIAVLILAFLNQNKRLDDINRRLDKIDKRLDTIEGKLSIFDQRITRLEERAWK